MLALRLFPLPSLSHCYKLSHPLFSPVSSLSPLYVRCHKLGDSSLFSLFFSGHTHTKTSETPIFYNFLIKTLKFPKSKALITCSRMPWVKTIEKPKSVLHYLESIGFSDAHIQHVVSVTPRILSADIEKTLKPKIEFFEELGLSGPELGNFISRNAGLLTRSLDTVIRPCFAVIKDLLQDDVDNHYLFLVLRRCLWIVSKSPDVRLLPNVEYLKSCGIVGTQLKTLFRRQPSIFAMPLPKLKELVSKVLDMGFSMDSRMLAHGLHSLSCISSETFERKVQLFKSYGFSEGECLIMFRKSPTLLRTSEDKLRMGLGFFLNTVEAEKSLLVFRPSVLMFSVGERMIPRYQVYKLVKSKKLVKKEPSFINVLSLTEDCFLEKYIAKFPAVADELLMAYKAHLLVSDEKFGFSPVSC